MKDIFYKSIIFKLLIISVAVRILVLIFVVEQNIENTNYWEYGAIAENLVNGKGYSLFYKDDSGLTQIKTTKNAIPVPSAYMPPGYVLFISPFFVIDNFNLRTNIIFIIQILISSIALIFLYKLTKEQINYKSSIFASIIYIFYPEFIYSCFTIGPTVFYHFFILILIYYLLQSYSRKNLIILSILLSTALYFRFEIALFWCFVFIYRFLKEKTVKFIIPLIISLVLLLPWLYRNYTVFNKFPILSTNTGQNLYRGHNNIYPGAWADEKLDKEIAKIPFSEKYELQRDVLLSNKAIEHIKTNFVKEIKISFEKIIHLFGIYYYDSRSFNLIYLVSWASLSFLFWFGFFSYKLNDFKIEILLFILFHILLAILFFVIIRYQTMFKIIYLPFAGYGLYHLVDKLKGFMNYSHFQTKPE